MTHSCFQTNINKLFLSTIGTHDRSLKMPPKKAVAAGPSKKTDQKKKEKVIEDKTFGLKNKKGAKNQKFIQHVTTQVQHGSVSQQKLISDKLDAEKKKKEEKTSQLDDLNKLLKPVSAMAKVGKDVDPKSVLCAFFKQGTCGKGDKCKFSHDLSLEGKSEKRSLYVDRRELEQDTMDDWDDEKLNDVIKKKHGEEEQLKPQTSIVCKYFLDAVENSKYGWFWECPNGDKCIYKHALPPGYILKKDKKKLEEQKQQEISLEELIEKERQALSSKNLTKVTLESFIAWKKRKLREKRAAQGKLKATKEKNFRAGKQGGLSGRDLFTFNPELIADDDAEADEQHTFERPERDDDEEADDEMEVVDIDESLFMTLDEEDLDDELVDESDAEPRATSADLRDEQGNVLETNGPVHGTANGETVNNLEEGAAGEIARLEVSS